jgi:sugar/nucleoside kinase (ribokinase family)
MIENASIGTMSMEVEAEIYLDVVCVGAALTDIIANTSRHPEDEQESFVDELTYASGGSAANTAAACAMLELRSGFVGRVGIDSFGDELLSNFQAIGVDVWGVVRDPDRPSGLC